MKKIRMSIMLMIIGVVFELKPASGQMTLVNHPLYGTWAGDHAYEYDDFSVVQKSRTGGWDSSLYAVTAVKPAGQRFESFKQQFETPKEAFKRLFKDYRLKEGGMSSRTLRELEPLVNEVDAQVREMEQYQNITFEPRRRIITLVVEFNELLAVVNELLFGEKSEKSSFTRRRTNGNIQKIQDTCSKLRVKQGEIKGAIDSLIAPYKAAKEAIRKEEEKKLFSTAEELHDLLLLKFLRETSGAREHDDYSKLHVYEKDATELSKRPLTPETKRRVTERMQDIRMRAEKVEPANTEESFWHHRSFAVPYENGGMHVVHDF